MAGWKHFNEIAAWQHSYKLKLKVYDLLSRPEFARQYKYCDQLREAARSGPRNIAEGFGRFGNKEFAQFSRIAKGSLVEALNHFKDAHDQHLLTDLELSAFEHLTRTALKATVGLIRHLENSRNPPRPRPKKLDD